MLESILEFSGSFVSWLWQTTWRGSVAIALVLLVQTVFRKQLSARWRYGLWLIVLVRLVLPASIESRLSLYNWNPLNLSGPGRDETTALVAQALQPGGVAGGEAAAAGALQPPGQSSRIPWKSWLGSAWLTGALVVTSVLTFQGLRLGRKIRRERQVTDGAVLEVLEDCRHAMGVCTPVALVETARVASPSLFGWMRPRLLLPEGLVRSFSMAELRFVFLHELAHVKRGDIALNWLATAVLALHWFNPIVWFAFGRMRVDGELACDALALTRAREAENKPYGQTIIKLIERFSRPALVPSIAGILEDGKQMKRRITMIANFRRNSGSAIAAVAIGAMIAVLTLTEARSADKAAPNAQGSGGPPQIVSCSPKPGDTEVDPALAEITVTFDRDMGGGFSWTGGGPDYPPSPEGAKAAWRDKRTCVLPVKLLAGRYYRVGINSTSYQNFRTADGVPARPSAIYFTTRGASEQVKQRALKPMIVSIEPKNGAQDVDSNLKELRVTFSVSMGEGFSWTGGGENFPVIPEGKKPYWLPDHKTCVLPVELKPGWQYRLGLNSPSHKNFQSAGGIPLDAVVYTFKTK